ncbi:hypothetical protein MNB_SV-13-1413 [hydrothermal vent metagenome]|uniref:Uncharacterized protein n=1 Tax=hydrothermal vent metagenome TaxID=652676 RepID=A0A1W1D0A1_9ZZZZ
MQEIDKSEKIKLRYRNFIKTKDGYIVILHKDKKNIEIFTPTLLHIEEFKRYNKA